jgi:hypothetical protein
MLDFLKEDVPKNWHSLCDTRLELELGLARPAIKCIMHYLLPTSDRVS